MPMWPHVSISAASVTPELRARWRIVASTASAWRRRDCVFVNSVRTAHAVAREGFMTEILSRAPRRGSGQRLRAPPVEKRTGWSGNRFPAPVCVHHVGFGLTFQRSAPILLGRERNPRKKGVGRGNSESGRDSEDLRQGRCPVPASAVYGHPRDHQERRSPALAV